VSNTVFRETAQRGEIIHAALKEANLGPITAPGDFSLDSISEIHEYGLLNLLQNAYERMDNEADGQLALPDTFPKRTSSRRKPHSIWGQMGHYAFDIYSPILEHTWDVAYWTVQVAISAAALVNATSSDLAYALCRPPGHHAGPNFYGGFCYLNNAAIAAHWLVQQGQRVAILDLDYHHGNGTQAVFYGRSEVLTCSIHADPLHEYPYFWGFADEYGNGSGEGYNFNYPLPRSTDEATYMPILDHALARINHHVPDTLVISFGANIVQGDPWGHFQLPMESLTRIGKAIAALEIPIVVIQEGGYQLNTLGESVVTFLKGLTNQ
jgi:acetoin utilization deacetylase AcuC-like enzyme